MFFTFFISFFHLNVIIGDIGAAIVRRSIYMHQKSGKKMKKWVEILPKVNKYRLKITINIKAFLGKISIYLFKYLSQFTNILSYC